MACAVSVTAGGTHSYHSDLEVKTHKNEPRLHLNRLKHSAYWKYQCWRTKSRTFRRRDVLTCFIRNNTNDYPRIETSTTVFWDVTPFRWVTVSRRFVATWFLHLQGFRGPKSWRLMILVPLTRRKAQTPKTQVHIPEYLDTQISIIFPYDINPFSL